MELAEAECLAVYGTWHVIHNIASWLRQRCAVDRQTEGQKCSNWLQGYIAQKPETQDQNLAVSLHVTSLLTLPKFNSLVQSVIFKTTDITDCVPTA